MISSRSGFSCRRAQPKPVSVAAIFYRVQSEKNENGYGHLYIVPRGGVSRIKAARSAPLKFGRSVYSHLQIHLVDLSGNPLYFICYIPQKNIHQKEEDAMESVYKIIEIIGSSPTSWEEAVRNAVETASKSLSDTRVAEITELDVKIEDGKVAAYRAKINLSFKYQA